MTTQIECHMNALPQCTPGQHLHSNTQLFLPMGFHQAMCVEEHAHSLHAQCTSQEIYHG